MRVFELLLAVTVVVAMVPRTTRLSPVGSAIVAALVGVSMALHSVVEGPRWQLVPVYALGSVVVGWRLVVGLRSSMPQRRRPQWVLAFGLVVVLLAGATAAALPVPTWPAPTGPLAVGTTSWALTDTSRDDPYRDGPRRLAAEAWYPTEATGDRAPWVSDAGAFSRQVAPSVGLPPFALRHLELTRQHALLDVPALVGDWPVVVYSHGWTGFRSVQSDLAEHLASNGFVVLALDHASGAAVTLPPGEDAIPLLPRALPDEDEVAPTIYAEASELLEQTFAEDVAFLLDQVAASAVPAPLAGLDLATDRVGLTGHSTGGGAMYRLCLIDDRCAALVGMDPWVEPVPDDLLDDGLAVPFVSLRSGEWQGNDNDGVLRAFHERSAGVEGLLAIPGSGHSDVTLQPFLTPLAPFIGLRGDVDAGTLHDAVGAVVLDHLDRHLRGGDGVPIPDLVVTDA